jgi:plastocyanin
MIRRPHAAALVAGAALVAAGSAFATSHPATAPALQGTVGPGFTISLKQSGKSVKTLKAGSYTFVVSDKADIHDFVLEKSHGGTFEKELTTVPFKGTRSVKVKLTPGEWEFYCRPHESTMHGDFTVK